MNKNKIEKSLIGRLEYVSFVDFNINKVVAKIDTGAYNGAVHASEIIEKDGKLKFVLLDNHEKISSPKKLVFEDFKIKKVKSSRGVSEKRYFIKTKIKLKDLELLAEFSLIDRGKMRYPVLIGRKIFKKYFIVDAGKKFTK